ncbi:MAG: sporulation initiation factor Spo0A C-terminal domain-containing protein, partial [Clostridia bacterium]
RAKEILEHLDANENSPKFIVLTVINKQQFILKSFACGAAYYMVKPAEPSQLLKRIIETSTPYNSESDEIPSFKYKSRSLDERISLIFMNVGIPAHIKGYYFLREGIKLAIEDPPIINNITKSLYPAIATHYNTSSSKVERAIRHAIEVAWNRGKIENINTLFGIKVYSGNDKPTNGEFIALLADKMLLEGA